MTSGYWPISQVPSPCILPIDLVQACKSFEQFYLSRHSGRRLTWQPSLGNADIRVSFKARKIELNVSTLAMVILLLFSELEEGEFLTYSVSPPLYPPSFCDRFILLQAIKDATTIVDNELQRHLQSLACAKFKILKKRPPSRDVSTNDSFSFNDDFTSAMQKVKINTISSKVESGDERRETRDRVDEERKHQIEVFHIFVFDVEF